MTFSLHAPSRRELIAASGVLFAWPFLPRIARAEGRDPRLMVVVLRGALDGLALAAPVGDPDWIKLRGDKALTLEGKAPGLPLDSFFALNPAMPNLHRLYKANQAIVVHAACTPYRDRSHFDGQDVLESGFAKPAMAVSGWLNRAFAAIEPEARIDRKGALGVGPVVPLVVRGPAPVLSWTPQRIAPASEDTLMRLIDLYQHSDPALARVLQGRLGLMHMAAAGNMDALTPAQREQLAGLAATRAYFAEAAGTAAKFMARAEGPRVGALSFNGWDTHIDEGAVGGRLGNLLGALDGALAAIESGMGPTWNETVVVLVTEFGRTAHINGDNGTDHGTGTVALLAGGALKGGHVVADWPGLKESDLFEKRDLKATTDLRGVLKSVLKDHLRIDDKVLAGAIFPDSAAIAPTPGLFG
ncbi:MAG TPA: DUF1501 domain-containing protein [Xanthobacteraceae bacterium]|jgi:uncharacterized protein (DUF1501 family)